MSDQPKKKKNDELEFQAKGENPAILLVIFLIIIGVFINESPSADIRLIGLGIIAFLILSSLILAVKFN